MAKSWDRQLAIALLIFSWLVMTLFSQVSSPDYKGVFFCTLPFAAAHMAILGFLFARVQGWGKACLAAFSSLALLSFLDLASRVWLHFGLLSWLLHAFGIKL